jgi:hypothetical protein
VEGLSEHASILGLTGTGDRLATARSVSALLKTVAAETDDVVLVDLVAQADVGDVDFAAASTAFKQAPQVATALTGTSWALLNLAASRAADDERFRTVMEKLRASARHGQHAADLVAALREATDAVTALLAQETKPDPGPRPPAGGKAGQREVHDRADLDAVVTAIEAELAAGHAVWVTWERR